MNLASGQVVKIVSKRHKYYGEEAVIRWRTKSMYQIRLRNKVKPLFTRFNHFYKGHPSSISSPIISMYARPRSVIAVKGKFDKPLINTWHEETLGVLERFKTMTAPQIEKEIGHKLVHWSVYKK